MLLLLTGDIQIGKTTWLLMIEQLLEEHNIGCDGVIAPGVWDKHDDGTFEKLGIDNTLFPGGTTVPFARREDLAHQEGIFDENSQAAQAQLKWHISDASIAIVNAHLGQIRDRNRAYTQYACEGTSEPRPVFELKEPLVDGVEDINATVTAEESDSAEMRNRILFIDELGRLELLRSEGLTNALGLLDDGPQGIYTHAIVIARDAFGLPEKVEERFSDTWGGCIRISPCKEDFDRWIAPLIAEEA